MIHTNLPRNCVVFLLLCKLTRSAIYGSQKFDSHKWSTVLVDEVKGKPCNLEACLSGSLYSTFTSSFYSYMYAFYNNLMVTNFSKTNSTDPRQCVPLKVCWNTKNNFWSSEALIVYHTSSRMGKSTTWSANDTTEDVSLSSSMVILGS